jgi:hypothetical protein
MTEDSDGGQIEEIHALLQRTENSVLDILAVAARAGDYERIDAAREIAAGVRALYERLGDTRLPSISESPPSPAERRRRAKTRTSTKRGYPQFNVQDDSLIKIGWSKKKHAEYTQRIPSAVFDQVIEGLGALGVNADGPVGSDTIFEWLDEHEANVPTYQTYGVLRFLRDRGIVRQVRRGEYAFPADVSSQGRAAWRAATGSG